MRLVDFPNLQAHPTAVISPDAYFYGAGKVVVGAFTRIDHGALLMGDIKIGKKVHISPYVLLYGKAGISIGEYTSIGACTVLHTENDDFSGESLVGPCVPQNFRPGSVREPIEVGMLCILGTRTTVLPGAVIRDGVAVGAHSLVKGTLNKDSIYAGAPAKFIRSRDTAMWELLQELEGEK
jgi:galactoside O-acetyltransferase